MKAKYILITLAAISVVGYCIRNRFIVNQTIPVTHKPENSPIIPVPPEKPTEKQISPLTATLEAEHREYLLKIKIRQAWRFNTPLFLKALLTQENGPSDNQWNFTGDFLKDVDATEKQMNNLSNWKVAEELILSYGKRYKAQDTRHMAAMFRKGPDGCYTVVAQNYGERVCNLIEFYLREEHVR